jgi:hypothetical protein
MFVYRLEHKRTRKGPWNAGWSIVYPVPREKLDRGVYPFHPDKDDKIHLKPALLEFGYKTAVQSLANLKEWFDGHFDLLHACEFEIAKYLVNKRKHKVKFGEAGQVLIPVDLTPKKQFPINSQFHF